MRVRDKFSSTGGILCNAHAGINLALPSAWALFAVSCKNGGVLGAGFKY
jgi:hypothetical protein